MGIPMGVRSAPQLRQQQEKFPQQPQKQKQLFRKRQPQPPEEDTDEEEYEREPSPDSADDFPSGTYERKRPRNQREQVNLGGGMKPRMNRGKDGRVGGGEKGSVGEKIRGNSVRELTQAILKFGEAYEQAETLKLQQLVDMEKQRMKFAKEMELQRMQFFMKTQLDLSQLKSRKVGNSNNHR